MARWTGVYVCNHRVAVGKNGAASCTESTTNTRSSLYGFHQLISIHLTAASFSQLLHGDCSLVYSTPAVCYIRS